MTTDIVTREPMIDLKTGQITPFWYRFLLTLFDRSGGMIGITPQDAEVLQAFDGIDSRHGKRFDGLEWDRTTPAELSEAVKRIEGLVTLLSFGGLPQDLGSWASPAFRDVRIREVLTINEIAPDSASDIEYEASGNAKRALFRKNLSGSLGGWSENLSTFQINTTLNGTQASSYSLGSVGMHVRTSVGNSSSTEASALAFSGNLQIYDTNNAGGGVCEFSPLLGVLNCRNAETNTGANLWHTDLNAYGPSSGQEGFIGAALMSVKYHNGTTDDGTHTGVHGWYAVTKPQGGGGKDDGVTGLTSYPAHAGVRVVGWSGPQTATSGIHADATAGWTYGLHVGGAANCGAWIGSPIRSKVVTGARLEDFTSYGLHIVNRHTDATGHAIYVESTAGNVGIHITPDTTAPLVIGGTTASVRTAVTQTILYVGQNVSTEDAVIVVGHTRSGNGASSLKLVGDGTYTDYGAKLDRLSGANGGSLLTSRGTGSLTIKTEEAGSIILQTDDTTAITISATQTVAVAAAFGCNGATPQTSYSVGAAATDAATTQTLANNLRTALINMGIATT